MDQVELFLEDLCDPEELLQLDVQLSLIHLDDREEIVGVAELFGRAAEFANG